MPQAKVHANNAERQAAYRARHRDRERPRQRDLAMLARALHYHLEQATRQERSPWPPELLGARADETLRTLVRYVRAHYEGEENP